MVYFDMVRVDLRYNTSRALNFFFLRRAYFAGLYLITMTTTCTYENKGNAQGTSVSKYKSTTLKNQHLIYNF